MKTIKQGGCYQLKNKEGWLIVGVKKQGYYQCREVYIDGKFYDEDIRDFDDKDIRERANLSICYRAFYHKKFGLYAVWDETKPLDQKIKLQNIYA